jgi:hypothetical protein
MMEAIKSYSHTHTYICMRSYSRILAVTRLNYMSMYKHAYIHTHVHTHIHMHAFLQHNTCGD